MGLGAIDYLGDYSTDINALATDELPEKIGDSWIDDIMDSMKDNGIKKKLFHAAKVHPCVINGSRVLVFEKGLKQSEPEAYEELLEFAATNNFGLKEDRRDVLDNKRGMLFERRMAKAAPMMLLAGGLFMQGAAQAAPVEDGAARVMPEVEVLGEKQSSERAYLVRDGKRFISGPYGEVESILAVAAETKQQGELKRVSTRNIEMPQEYVGGYINRYDYNFPESCGGGKYSYYEGEGFGALGYHKDGKVVLDVLVGGGAFGAPKLWGPYDQVLYDNHEMQLMMGDGKNDGMGLLKASYSIGMTAVMADEDFQDYGNSYTNGVQSAIECVQEKPKEKAPVIRQASAGQIVSLR